MTKEHLRSAVHVILRREDEILILKRFNTGLARLGMRGSY